MKTPLVPYHQDHPAKKRKTKERKRELSFGDQQSLINAMRWTAELKTTAQNDADPKTECSPPAGAQSTLSGEVK